MDRLREPTEFGFPTGAFLPPDYPRPLWRTLVIGALLSMIPLVGPGVGAIYVDRRRIPGTYDFVAALKTALIQLVALAVLAVLIALVFGVVLGVRIELEPRIVGPGR